MLWVVKTVVKTILTYDEKNNCTPYIVFYFCLYNVKTPTSAKFYKSIMVKVEFRQRCKKADKIGNSSFIQHKAYMSKTKAYSNNIVSALICLSQ